MPQSSVPLKVEGPSCHGPWTPLDHHQHRNDHLFLRFYSSLSRFHLISTIMAYNFQYTEDMNNQFHAPNTFHDNSYNMPAPVYTSQDFYAFEPAQQVIYGECGMGGYDTGMDMDMGMDGSMGYYGMDSDFSQHMAEASGFIGSCEPSPFTNQIHLNPALPTFVDASLSPVTPSGSPMPSFYENPCQQTYVLIPAGNDGQYQQYCAFQFNADSYLGSITLPAHQPTFASSPVEEPPALEAEVEDDEDDDASLLPDCGNKGLCGIGLYDTPELMEDDLSPSPLNGSPITPTGQLRPLFGKGLMLEKSFGLPEEMMMKDEVSGKIFKGKLRVDDEPVIYHDPMHHCAY
ncbi:hypothetical protein EX30DRAFT_395436 [Ascodesmis nigricans]|uniref:Uncharacterized protein n=1 Tax=Ascodesmis nigricans TaxID=341454 RepID=A0A4S2MY87_9PEZI|nr:hypothetical protein EX30DRAFT_395436 [Ascodesmis nigricans]